MIRNFRIFILFVISLLPAVAQAQTDTLAFWHFENQTQPQFTNQSGIFGPINADLGSGSIIRECQNGSFSIVFSNAGNGSTKSLHVSNWTTTGDYVQFKTSTMGKSNVQLMFDQASSNGLGPRDWKLSYSTDNINFTDLPSGNYMQSQMSPVWNTTTYQAGYSHHFVLPAALDNKADVYLRISITSTINISGNPTVNTGTNTRLDNILITGTPYVSPRDTLAMWTFESQSGQPPMVPYPNVYGPIPPEQGAGEMTRHRQAAVPLLLTYANPGNGTPKSFTSSMWHTIGDYIQFKVNTTGFSDIEFSFEQQATTVGPRDLKISYSTDGTNFTDLSGSDFQTVITPTNWLAATYQSGFHKQFSLSAALNDMPEAYIRISTTSTMNAQGNTTISPVGALRMDNVLISGIPFVPITQITNIAVSDSSICASAGDTVAVSFNSSATAATTYNIELSDAAGSFASPTVIGAGASSPISAAVPTSTAEGYNYRIRVVDGTSISQNTSGPIIIHQAISILQHPIDSIACEGAIVLLQAEATMPSNINAQKYYWLFNNIDSLPSPWNNHAITAAMLSHSGNYRMVVTRGACRDTTHAATVTINPGTILNNTTAIGSRHIAFSSYPIIANNGSCGRLAIIHPSANQQLNDVTVNLTAGSPQQVGGASGPWYVGRYHKVIANAPVNGNVGITFYYTSQDWDDYNLSAPASQQIVYNEAAQTISNLYFSRLNNINDLATANGFVIAPDSVSFQNGYWKVSLSSNVLNNQSTFYAHGNNFIPCVAPTITILATANNVCVGTTVSFSATITSQGVDPDYLWKVNGLNMATTPNYTYTPANGDIVTCVLTKPSCFNPIEVTSNPIVMQVNPIGLPSVIISTNDTNYCAGAQVTYTASGTNEGTSPIYQWKVNGANSGTNAATFTYVPNNTDIITCELTSNAPCLTSTAPVLSNAITMHEVSLVTASILIATNDTNACAGMQVVYTATASNGGVSPVYQWKVNGTNTGTNSTTFNFVPNNADIITCELTSNAACLLSAVPVLSNAITMNVNPVVTPSITIAANKSSSCSGEEVIYTATATNVGTNPVYQWKVNGINMGMNATTFTYVPSNTDAITCELTSNASCLSSIQPILSNSITADVSATVPASITITSNLPNGSAVGATVIYTANVSGATVYGLDWYVNNVLFLQQQNPDHTITRTLTSVSDTVYAVLKVNGCFTDSVYISDLVVITPSTNLSNLNVDLGLQLFPNPVLNNLTIELNKGTLTEIQLFNPLGQVLHKGNAKSDNIHTINLSQFTPGFYYIKVQINYQGRVYEFIKKIIKN